METCMWQFGETRKNITILHINGDGDSTSVSRKQKDSSIKDLPCPEAVKLYNQFMNGVDHADQLGSTYTCSTARKALNWWKYLFFFLFDISIVNSFFSWENHQNMRWKWKQTGADREIKWNLGCSWPIRCLEHSCPKEETIRCPESNPSEHSPLACCDEKKNLQTLCHQK